MCWSGAISSAPSNLTLQSIDTRLAQLGTQPEETLFIDDKRPNVEAARALGIQAIEYSSVERLREELIAAGLDGVLPLPG